VDRKLNNNNYNSIKTQQNPWLIFLYIWIVIMGLVGLQRVTTIYQALMLREVFTVLLLIGLVFNIRSRKQLNLFIFIGILVSYISITVARSTFYNTPEMIHLLVRIIQYMILIIAIPVFIRSWQDVRSLFLFIMFFSVLVSLTAPLQEITGPLPWFEANWEWEHGRAGFARFLSFFGDPNIAGMIGGILPLSLFAIKKKFDRQRTKLILREATIFLISILLVAYSLSLTGILLFVFSSTIIFFSIIKKDMKFPFYFKKKHLISMILRLCFFVFFVIIIFSYGLDNRIEGTISRFFKPSESSRIQYGETHLIGDLSWRLFEYLNINDTIPKLFFGSTYDIVTPAGYINPYAIKAHNGYKEIYIAGGLLGFGLYMILFINTGSKAIRILHKKRRIIFRLEGIAYSSSWIYLLLLIAMFGFPVYHYNGVGIIFWGSAGLIHIIYNKFYIKKDKT